MVVAAMGGTTAAGDGFEQHEVSQEQYQTLLGQCRYADTAQARTQCRRHVKATYRIGRTDTTLDCRTFTGVTVCGTLKLSKAERQCTKDSTDQGLSYRRAEVECYALS
ncbi:hypothetical protein ETD86_40760 [Nonomuraea turkmeniaca]|uniref:Uncharacterized protein n=1 Tax=Nonomuraea turkmeniaca TaxID=103838 RepID=A0A5S4F207_9ACTN|nr:hypothetical protein ETD86_40760 [Nonomuraea turkmeniaca]